jgi:hypothetical protein
MRAIDLIRVETKAIKWLTDNLSSGVITVDNSYQRKYIWQPKDQIALIETILLGYPIPEIYLWANDTDPETGDTKYSIVDGQQRLTTIQRFLNDDFKLNKSGLDDKQADYAGKIFSELSVDHKKEFWKYQFSSRFINDSLDRDEISKLFLRLNRTSTTLNPQELRNAEFNGKFLTLAEELSKNDFWEAHFIFSKSEIRRMQDIQFISTLLIFIRMGIEKDNNQSAINQAYDQYNESYPEASEDHEIVCNALSVMGQWMIGKDVFKPIVKRTGHLYFLFLLAYTYLEVSKIRKIELDFVGNKLEEFFRKYTSEDSEDMNESVEEYRELSQEGSKKTFNRQRRFEILKKYCFP